ncbi:MAG: MogA/MoaB family molybdenum cofactor biosynthesis protein [Acidobacteriota bacterium]|nr:MogA/MoaB family molybdenum cofactor biosynthesis protein [Acidobacteriota bacterium]
MIEVAILTVSDSAFAGKREDLSGPALKKRCDELSWNVRATAIIPDDAATISRQLAEWADEDTPMLILTTGGTGVSARDNTPEATRAVLERELPGIGELLRAKGLEQTRFSVLSRGVAGTRKQAFVVNLPGSPAGALFSLDVIEHLVKHVVNLLSGETGH